MLSASHLLLAQARFCERTHLPLSPNSTTPIVQVISRYLRPDAPVFNITTVDMVTFRQSPCWYYPWADIILSTSSDTQHLWTWWHFGDHTGLINLSTTSTVFTPAGHVNILQNVLVGLKEFLVCRRVLNKVNYLWEKYYYVQSYTRFLEAERPNSGEQEHTQACSLVVEPENNLILSLSFICHYSYAV